MEGFSLEDPAFRCYAFCAAVLVSKMLLMSPLTSRHRLKKNIFANPEDSTYFGHKKFVTKVKFDDVDVERVRRAHLNDMENIPIFLFISALYLLTSPSAWLAMLLMRTFTVCRVLHTLVYAVMVIPQPARAIVWGIALGITVYMAISVGLHFV